ncbi:MAG TPA: hypothetical protein VJA21_09570 [Verrucomicrobiae bacterium]
MNDTLRTSSPQPSPPEEERESTPALDDSPSERTVAGCSRFASRVMLLAAAEGTVSAAEGAKQPEELVATLTGTDEAAAAAACDAAPEYGAAAVRPLALAMANPDFEVARRCKRALYRIVRQAGRPGAKTEAAAVEAKLVTLISEGERAVQLRRDLLWMLSEIGSARAVPPVAALLADKELREDARCVLTRLPSPKALVALRKAFKTAPEDFRFALADSLRARGEKVEGYPSRKLVATKQTTVTPKK